MIAESLKKALETSKVINFFVNFNKMAMSFFLNSATYKIYANILAFFRQVFLVHAEKSFFIKTLRRWAENFSIEEAGIFIIAVVIFNTIIMILLKKPIDPFSIIARIFSILLALRLIYKREKKPR